MMKDKYKYLILLVVSINTVLVCVNIGLVIFNTTTVQEQEEPILHMEKLYLTPHLNTGDYLKAQELANVQHPKFLNIQSYSGYLTINESTDSHMFFWHFPAEQSSSKAPLLLCLQGGPGDSSMFAVFTEIGPFIPISQTDIELREYSWHKHFNLLFLDNPVGTGFSITNNGYVTNDVEVGRDLYTAMQQFLQLFPDLAYRDFYISGSDYAGKYASALGYTIHVNNQQAEQQINLKGLMIANGWLDPINQMDYADYLYQHGLVDSREAEILRNAQDEVINLYKQEKYQEAFKMYSDLIVEDVFYTPNGSLFSNFTGFYNFFNNQIPYYNDTSASYMVKFLNQMEIKSALHVGDFEYYSSNQTVNRNLDMDKLASVAAWMSELLSYYRVLLFNGQLDIIVTYPSVHNFLQNLNFSAAAEYKAATREKWYYEMELAGYYTVAGNLTEVMVRNAGHMIPFDQPKWTFQLVDRFINNKSLN